MAFEATEVQTEGIDGYALLAENGLESIADTQFEAHGQTMSLADAIRICGPLGGMITSLAANLAHIPGHEEIIKNTLLTAAATAPEMLTSGAKKKLI